MKITFIQICQIGAHIVKSVWKMYILVQLILIWWNSCDSDYCTPKIGTDHSLEVARPAAVTVVDVRFTEVGTSSLPHGRVVKSLLIIKAAYLVY